MNQPLFEIGLEPIYELVEDIMEMSKQERDFMSQKISDYLGEGYESENHFIDGYQTPLLFGCTTHISLKSISKMMELWIIHSEETVRFLPRKKPSRLMELMKRV